MKTSLTFRTRCLGTCLKCGGLESWSVRYGSQVPFLLKKNLAVGSCILIVWHGFYDKRVSQPFLPISVYFHWSNSADFWIFFTGNSSMCNCIFGISMGGTNLRSLLCYYVDWFYVLILFSWSTEVTIVGNMENTDSEMGTHQRNTDPIILFCLMNKWIYYKKESWQRRKTVNGKLFKKSIRFKNEQSKKKKRKIRKQLHLQ